MSVELSAETTVSYSNSQVPGIMALFVVGLVSFTAIFILVVVMIVKRYKAAKHGCEILPQTHAAAYFASLLVANLVQSIGFIINIDWLIQGGTVYEPACIVQGVVKNVGDVGIALWSLIIAFHAFDVLFLRHKQRKLTLWITLIGTWIFVFCIDMIGPILLETPSKGPFFGVSGYWCWITSNYPEGRIFLEYMFMFVSAVLCAIIYAIIFLRLRGNISGDGWRNIRFRCIPRSEKSILKVARDEVDSKMYNIVTQLMWYPLVYAITIVPIAVARFINFAGHDVPFWMTIMADLLFNLNGFFNVLLFAATYRRISVTYLPSFSVPRRSLYLTNYGITPFILPPRDGDKTTIPQRETPHNQDLETSTKTERRLSVSTVDSFESTGSTAPLTRQMGP